VLVLFHDYTSPASAVAVARVTRLVADGLQARIEGTVVLGVEATLPVTLDLLAELDAVAARAGAEGVVLRRPDALPPTASAHLVEDLAGAIDRADAWRARCYRAFWTDGEDIADPGVLRRLAADVGLPVDEVSRRIGDRMALLEIRQRFAGHRRDGVGGVPTIAYDRTLVPGLLDEADLRALAALDPSSG
jgi:predicted DsbA family dithiol-disulfide isomerase